MFIALLKDGGLGHWTADPRHRKYTDAEKALIERARQEPAPNPVQPYQPAVNRRPQTKPLQPKAGNVNLVDTGYVDYKGRKILLNSTAKGGNAVQDFIAMAQAAAADGIDIGPGISSAYRDAGQNAATPGSVKNSSHMYGEAFDINWNTTAGKWIRKNAHKFGFIHADYKATSTHFNYTGQKTEEQPPSTLLSFNNPQPAPDPSALEEPESPTFVPFPINKNNNIAQGGGGSKSKDPPAGS